VGSVGRYLQPGCRGPGEGERLPAPQAADLSGLNTVSARINALRARVFDDELRALVREAQLSIWHAIEASDWREQPERMVAARDPVNRMHERMHHLLKELFLVTNDR
jgi:hypothetical protein